MRSPLWFLASVAVLAWGPSTVRGQQPGVLDAAEAFARGQAWFEKQEWAKAVAEFDTVIRLDPKAVAGWERRAVARLHLKEWDKAIPDFDEAIRLNPKLASAFSNRGVAWQSKGELDKAVADYTEAIRLNPRYAPAFHNRGIIRSDRGEFDKAIEDYTEAVRLNPRYDEAFANRGIVWASKGEYEKALADFDKAVDLAPKGLRGLHSRAWFRATCPEAKFRDGAAAVRDAKAAHDQPGDKTPYHFATLAAAHAEAGAFDEAVKWQKKALEDAAYAKANGGWAGEVLKLYEAKKPYRDPPPEKSKP